MSNDLFLRGLNKINSALLWHMLSYKSKKALDRSYFILSFDCDTQEDIDVAEAVHDRLEKIGVRPVYAVPGALLRQGAKVYKRLYDRGAEFINHGGREHTYFDEEHQRYASNFFYDQQPFDVLKRDIEEGHQAIQNVLGFVPKGWRTPHFGTFQKPEHLAFLYSTLKEMGYQFSTSTSPLMGYKRGGVYDVGDLLEMPVSGCFTHPLSILDTWGYFEAPDRIRTPQEYTQECSKMSAFSEGKNILINIYGDPSHIHGKDEFFEGIEILSQALRATNYSSLIGEYR